MGRALDEDPGDDEILARAHNQGRVLVTLDKDFGELAVVHRRPHSGILRLVNLAAREQGIVAARVFARYGDELRSGAIVTVDARKIGVRPRYTDESSNGIEA